MLFHHLHRVFVGNLGAAASEIAALAADSRRKVADIEGELLICEQAMDHQDVPGAEICCVCVGIFDTLLEGERDGLAVQKGELVRPVEESDVDSAPVGTFIVDNLVVGRSYFRFADQIFQHKAVLYLGDSQDGVEPLVALCHLGNDVGHVRELLPVLRFRPSVCSVGKEFRIVLDRIVIGVEQVLQIVEAYHIVLLRLLSIEAGESRKQDCQD